MHRAARKAARDVDGSPQGLGPAAPLSQLICDYPAPSLGQPQSQPLPQPKAPRLRLCASSAPARAHGAPTLAVLARFAAALEQDEHDFPMADWAELLRVLAPEDYSEPPTAAAPTTHLAGSVGKFAVMMGKIARGLSPFHPQDGLPAWRVGARCRAG